MKTLLSFWTDERGAVSIEYALVASLVSIAAVATLHEIGPSLTELYERVETAFEE